MTVPRRSKGVIQVRDTLEDAAAAMVRGGFRHLVVLDGDEVLGIISVRDILRMWSEQRAASPTPA